MQVTDQGVTWDGNHWPWEAVLQIRTTPDLPATGVPDRPVYLMVTVKCPWFRSRLTLSIEIGDDIPLATIRRLREHLAAMGYTIPWR